MPIDQFVPTYDFHERHQAIVPAPTDVVRLALEAWQPEESLFWRVLFRLRGLARPRGTLREWAEGSGFLRLADTAEEVVYGQIGGFWAGDERRVLARPRTVEEFLRFSDPRATVVAMNVRLKAITPSRTRITTETRVRALGPEALRRFRLYWLLIRPFSGLLRRAMLRGIAQRAIAAYRRSNSLSRPHTT